MRKAWRAALFHLLGDPQKDGPGAVRAFDDGVLLVEDGHIAAAGSWDELGTRLGGAPVEKLDGILVPGFIDTHVHFPQTGIIASPGARLLEWLANYTFPAEERFADKQVATAAARFFLEQLLAHGTTSALVFATVHKVSAEALFEEALARNMRIICGKVLMDRGAPPGLCDTAETGAMESRSLIRQWHGRGRLGYAVTPRFALTSTADQLEMAGKLLAETPGVHLHTHLSENPEELAAMHRLFPDCPDYFSVYEKYGLAGPHSVFAHCLHLSPAEWSRLGKSGSNVAFCPTSNLFLGSGLFDLAAAQEAGVRVGLGTDIGAGTSLSLLQTMNEAYKVCQMKRCPMDAFMLFYFATLGGARALRLEDRIGNFERGKEADFVLLDSHNAPMLRHRLANTKSWDEKLFAYAMLGDDRAVARTWVAGENGIQAALIPMLPLAELHLHLEGSVRPGLARALAQRHGVTLADIITSDDTYLWKDFSGFIAAYDRVSDAVLTPEDYFAITRDYYVRAAGEGLIYGECFVSPAHAARKGIGYESLIAAVDGGMAAAEIETGVIARIIISCVRHLGPDHAVDMARLAAKHPHARVTGFGMGGDERLHSPGDFAPAFAIAGEAGLGLTAHAGELAGPDSIRAALAHLGITRLGHGVRAGEDAALLAELKDRGIALELCPSSNVALGLFADIAAHPVAAFARAGLMATLSTDDPPYFGASIGGEYAKVAAAHAMSREEMLGFTRRSLAAAFVDEDTRARLLAKVV